MRVFPYLKVFHWNKKNLKADINSKKAHLDLTIMSNWSPALTMQSVTLKLLNLNPEHFKYQNSRSFNQALFEIQYPKIKLKCCLFIFRLGL